MPKNLICFIDFGAVGYFGPSLRQRIERISLTLANRDVEGAIEATIASWEPLPLRDIDGFVSDLKPVYQRMISNAASKHGDPNLKSNGYLMIESARLAAKYGIQPPWDHLRFARLMWEYDTMVVTLEPNFNFSKGFIRYFRDRTRRKFKDRMTRKFVAGYLGSFADSLAGLPQDLADARYQVRNMIRRSDHLYKHSMSKLSYFSKMLIEYVMIGLGLVMIALVYERITLGADGVNEIIAGLLPLGLPWWLCALFLVDITVRLQRIRVRVSDID